ncbi:unnamed protein product [Musa banksii]
MARARQDNPPPSLRPSRAQYLRAGSEATSRGNLVVASADEAQVAPHLQTLRDEHEAYIPSSSISSPQCPGKKAEPASSPSPPLQRRKPRMFPSMSLLWYHISGEPVESHTRSSGSSFSATEECWRSIGGDNACAHGEASRRPDYTLLLEPKQDALAAVIRSARHRLPSLLPDFFNATLGASDFCGSLVESIRRARVDQIKLHEGFPVPDARRRPVTATLRRLSRLHNPFSDSARLQFERIHQAFDPLVRRLIHAHRRAMRRLSHADLAARAASFFACGVAVTIQAPFARAEAQLGAAARGAFALDRDFDTMGSMVRRLGDEIEHTRNVIKLFTDDGDDDMGEGLMLKEVARELQVSGCEFMNKLAELEEHVSTCFLNINRTRRIVMQEIVAHQQRQIYTTEALD